MNDPDQSDHDILITFKAEVSAKLDRVISDVKDLKDNVASRVSALEEEKVNESEFVEYRERNDDRYDRLAKLVYIGLGIVLTLEFAITVYVTYFHP
jgi:hypothetical protein